MRSQAVVPAHSKKYRVDLMFRAADDTRVIVELKRGEPHGDAAFGLSKYAKALQANGKTVRAVLITARPTDPVIEETVREQLTQVPCPVSWYWYDLDVRFEKLV